ncbi:glycoside hydrolase family 18 protein [Agromyces sp. H3Y2-19a]|uniref:glycoside hydrolase family 18 protein n=1 Tax=Agromyces TaxID=33877 RepID=UPI001E45C007|nr:MULTISPECIES: glycoside hydrolase family 18 protein [Agromyces]MCD5346692.1 glycoside hydrolase family 18 protein [Agromyces sp. S2-1-8]MDF0513052.1 glycoside hydrolase family 18 protein [Agromyces chromiiresistens]
MSPRPLLRGAAIAAATTALIAASAAAPAVAKGHDGPEGPSDINGYRSVGYLMADTPVTRDFEIEDLLTTGAIEDVTHINYAFGNVTANLACEITDVAGEGDAYNDYLRLVSPQDSVDGKRDLPNRHQRLAGNFNQLKKLKAVSPETKVLISLGGWTWSDNFSAAAATAESRERLVSSCIDLYLKGDLPRVGHLGGPGAAAGVFDGIDVDWEWPVNGGETANASPADRENFLALMEEFRRQLDAYGAETGEDYLLTAFAPAGGWNTNAGGWTDPRLFDVVDWLNIQGYDYAGGWTGNTGHQGNLHPDGSNNWGLALDNAVGLYTAAGARPEQLNVGIPAYGQGWTGVTVGDRAVWTPDPAVSSIGTKPYYEIRSIGEGYYDPAIGASWRYDAATGQWWSLDDPKSVEQKAEWLAEQGYGGAMWWDLSGDYRNELGGALGETLRAAEEGPLG